MRYNFLAMSYYLTTGLELQIVNRGTIDFTLTSPMPDGSVTEMRSRWNADGSMTLLSFTVR